MSKLDEKALGRRLQAARLDAGLTQQGLCQKADLSYSTLTKIERGAIKSPSIFTVQSIAEALGVTLDELIGHSNAPAGAKEHHRSESGVSFVYFDVNGCLVRFYQRAFARLAENSGRTADTVETIFWHYNDQVCRGDMSLAEFNVTLAQKLGLNTLDWVAYYLEAIEPMPEMSELVIWASQHYGVGLLTNIMPGIIDTLRSRGIIPDVKYDSIIDSSVAHAIKPEAKIYELATERAGCPPDEILLADDSRTNLMAADKLGWHVLWFDDYRAEESAARIRSALEPAKQTPLSGPEPVAATSLSPAVNPVGFNAQSVHNLR